MQLNFLALAVGLLSLRWLPRLPEVWQLVALGGVALLCGYYARWRPLAWLVGGFCWACIQAGEAVDDRLPTAWDGRTFWLEGQVQGLPTRNGQRLQFELGKIRSRHAGLPSRLYLAWYDAPASLQSGDRWRLAVRLRKPRGLLNPGGFDREAWLLSRHWGATGTVKAGNQVAEGAFWQGLRGRLRDRLLALDAWGQSAALAALVVGDGAALSNAQWSLLQATGTTHLMVISGQHVGLLAGLLFMLVQGLARIGWWPPNWPWLPWACGLSLLGSLGYGLLAGFDTPVQRACIMIACLLLWRLRFRQLAVWLPYLVALNSVLLMDPLASLQNGFWLSFGAVAILILAFSGRLGTGPWWLTLIKAQWVVAIGLLPILLALGLPSAPLGPVANLLAVPWVSLLVVPLALLGTLLLPVGVLGSGLLEVTGGLLAILFEFLAKVAALGGAWSPAIPTDTVWCSLALGCFLLVLPRGLPLRLPAIILLLPLWLAEFERPARGQAWVRILDVGQGLAVLVQTQTKALLYDAGPRYPWHDLGARVVVPTLQHVGVRQLDILLLSHADNDHAGGALAVHQQFRPPHVLSGEVGELPAQLQAEPCSGLSWVWDDVYFQSWRWAQAKEGNQASCVLRIEARGESLLLTGDIDLAAEHALVHSGQLAPVDWLLLPHHGSHTSSSRAFLHAMAPSHAVVSRGYQNPFGHPHPEVLARLAALGIPLQDTAWSGALKINLGQQQPQAQSERDNARFWR